MRSTRQSRRDYASGTAASSPVRTTAPGADGSWFFSDDMLWVYMNGVPVAMKVSPVNLVRAELPERIRNRLKLSVETDPYYMRFVAYVEVMGQKYSSGPIEVEFNKNGEPRVVLPDWFISHCCTVPLTPEPS